MEAGVRGDKSRIARNEDRNILYEIRMIRKLFDDSTLRWVK
jgi:hypothetical protein